jgi:hypothetical protein
MPSGKRRPYGAESFFIQIRKRVETSSTSAFQKRLLRFLILDQEKIGMKFKESMIISS